MTNISCPNCENLFPVTDAAEDYDWNSGVYIGGVREVTCPYCEKELTIYAHGFVSIQDVVTND